MCLAVQLLGACEEPQPAAPPTPATVITAAPERSVTAPPETEAESPAGPAGEPLAGAPAAGALPAPQVADGVPAPLATVGVESVFPALAFDRMVGMQYIDAVPDRLYVVLQEGRIVTVPDDINADSHRVFLDLRDRVSRGGNEEGLLGLAFDPDYQGNGYFYVYYSAAGPRRSVLSRFSALDGRADPDSERVVLEVDQPYSNHNGGEIAFGPDGFLYVALGDGGSAGDPFGHGQNLATLLGSILRIDVSKIDEIGGYVVPEDNPFVDEPGARPEIWAWGLRNPWRFSFDRLNGDLWTADVGQNRLEEVDLILPGANYGWNIMEGSECYADPGCSPVGLELPLAEYGRGDGCSVTGGYVYRGDRLPSLYGAYIYGDFCSGKIWALRISSGVVIEHRVIADTDLQIASFAEGPDGEVYVISFTRRVYRFTEKGPIG